MIDSILPALGLGPTLRIVYVPPLPRAPLTRLHPAFSPFGLSVHLIASPHFDELRRPANLALQVTFTVIYPAAPAQSRVNSFAPADFGLSACPSMSLNSHWLDSADFLSVLFHRFMSKDAPLCAGYQ